MPELLMIRCAGGCVKARVSSFHNRHAMICRTSIQRWLRGIAEDGVRSPDITHISEVGQGKAVEPLRLVTKLIAAGAKHESPVAQRKATAVPVVHRLNTCVLQLVLVEVVPAMHRHIETAAGWFADLKERCQKLALQRPVRGPGILVHSIQ